MDIHPNGKERVEDNAKAKGKDGAEGSYGAADITVLEGLEAVRKRPGMYIGSTGVRGLHHLVYEVVDNSVDEALAGHCDSVQVTIHPDNSVTVIDNGRGIPVGMLEKEGRPAAEVVLTVLHAGGKFGDGGGYKVSGGLHGVGVSVVNALSERLHLVIKRKGNVYTQDYERGKPQNELTKGEKSSSTGTEISFLPDTEIFLDVQYDYATLAERMRETAFLTRGLRITLTDERGEGQSEEFYAEGGLVDFVAHLNAAKDALHKKTIFIEGETDDGALEVAMQWNTGYQESLFSFANNINTTEGGSHLSGFRSALTRTLNAYAREKGMLKEKDPNLSGRRRARGPDRGRLGEAPGPAVRGPDEDQARQPADRGLRAGDRQPQARRVPRGEPRRRPPDRAQVDRLGPRPRRGPQGPRPDPPQVGARELDAAGQARRLQRPRPEPDRAVHRRGRLGRRLGQAGARSRDPGGAAAVRQDHQRREEPDRQGAGQRRGPEPDHGDRHRRARGVRHRRGALPQARDHDRRGRRRRPHPDPDPDLLLPADAGADRARLRLYRQAAAVPGEERPQRALPGEGVGARGVPAPRQAGEVRDHRSRRPGLEADAGQVAALQPLLQGVRGLDQLDAGRLRARPRALPERIADPRLGRRQHRRRPRS